MSHWQCGVIFFHQVSFELTRNAQIWPRTQKSDTNGIADGICLIASDIFSKSGSGMDYILGQVFLERFYSVYSSGGGATAQSGSD